MWLISDEKQTHQQVNSLTSSVRLPGVKLSPERNAVKVGALDLTEIPRACRALLHHTVHVPQWHVHRPHMKLIRSSNTHDVDCVDQSERWYLRQYCRTWSVFSPPDNTFHRWLAYSERESSQSVCYKTFNTSPLDYFILCFDCSIYSIFSAFIVYHIPSKQLLSTHLNREKKTKCANRCWETIQGNTAGPRIWVGPISL